MARAWVNEDANGKPLTDGRVCLVITSDEDETMPPIRVYGKDREEVLDKLANTAEKAQTTIHRLRTKPAVTVPPTATAAQPVGPRTTTVTAEQITVAAADLQNPAKAPEAVKVLLRAAGFNADAAAEKQAGERLAAICQKWERDNPEYPKDPRNDRALIDRAIVMVKGNWQSITADTLDVAYRDLMERQMIFEPKPANAEPRSTVQPDGSRESRTVMSTSYRRNSIRAAEPVALGRESAEQKQWREIFEKGTSRDIRNAVETIPGFKEWVDKTYAAKTA